MRIGKQFREFSVDLKRADGAEPDDTLEFSFSSEEPVERWFGDEVLSHKKGSPDLSRLNGGANALWNHDTDVVTGVVEKAWIGQDKRGYVKTRWGTSARAQEIRKDVEAGIIRNVSFAYQIQEMTQLNPGVKGEKPKYLATRWSPYEVSFVSVPADATVGIGRAVGDEELEVPVINQSAGSGEEKNAMDEEQKKAEAAKREAEVKQAREDAKKLERERSASIRALGEKFKNEDLARQLIEGDKSIDEAREAFLSHLGATQKPINERGADIGMNDKELQKFSFMRIINALANPNDRAAQEAAKFEREVSEAEAKRSGKTPRGFLVPTDVLRAGSKRDMTAGSSSGGGYSVATDLQSGSFIELLRNVMVTQRLGATVLNGLTSNIAIPKLASASTAYWVAENSAVTESAPALGQVAMTPKTVGGFVDISRRLMIQSDLSIDNLVKGDLAKVIGLAIDSKALYGDGSSNTITGVRSATGLNTVDFSAADPTWAEIVAMETAVAADNADVGALKYATSANGRGVLKSTLVTATYGDRMLWGPDNTINGYPVEVSNQISKLSTADYDYFFGNWADLMIGFWSGLDILVDPYTGGSAGTVRIVAMQDVDCAVRHGESFCYGNKTIS